MSLPVNKWINRKLLQSLWKKRKQSKLNSSMKMFFNISLILKKSQKRISIIFLEPEKHSNPMCRKLSKRSLVHTYAKTYLQRSSERSKTSSFQPKGFIFWMWAKREWVENNFRISLRNQGWLKSNGKKFSILLGLRNKSTEVRSLEHQSFFTKSPLFKKNSLLICTKVPWKSFTEVLKELFGKSLMTSKSKPTWTDNAI